MGEADNRAAHITRIQESAQAVQAAAAAWENARDIENEAKVARLAEGAKHREAIAKFQQELVDGWKAGVEIPKLLEASGISKPRLYQLIQKLERQES
jgi:2-keto-4-pentenoate hydratase